MHRLFKSLAGPLALALLMFSGIAHADDIFTPPSTDWTMQYILTPLFGAGTSFANSPLSGMMGIFNAAVLFVGGLLAAYTIIAGTMSTAHDGEVLGAKWSSMWVPVRTALGTAAILPVLNGFCLAQAIMLWLAQMGIGLADTLWTSYLQNFQQQAVYHNPSLDAKLRPLFESMVLSNVCYESIVASYNGTPEKQQAATQYLAGTSNVAGSVGPTWFQNGATAFGGGSAGYNYGQTDDNGPDTSACGKVTIKLTSTSASGSNTQVDTPMSAQVLVNMPAVTSQIEQAHIAGLKAMQTAANAAALQFLNVSNGNGIMPSAATINAAINAGVDAYSTAVSSVAQQAFNSAVNQDMVSAMAKDGWASAGASYMRIMQAQSQVNAAVGNLPVGVDGMTAGTTHLLHLADQRVDDDVDRAKDVLKDADRVNDGTVTDGNTDGFSKIINVISGHSWTGSGTFDPKEDPIITASNLGTGMIDAAGRIGSAVALAAVTAAVPLVGNITMALGSMFGPFISAIMLALSGSGATLAYGEPMIPFITSTAVLIAWTIMLLEAIVAAPLAAIMLLNPHQEAFGGLEKAMSLTLSVTLRPALAIFGLVGSILVMSQIGYFVNSFFGWAFAVTPGGGFLSLVKMVAGAVIYMALILTVTKKVFSIMTTLPDTVLNWIGSGGHGAVMGQASEVAKQGTSNATAAGMGAVGGLAATAARGLGNGKQALDDAKKKYGALKQERAARATERKTDDGNADRNASATRANAEGGDALKKALGGDGDGAGNLSAQRQAANQAGANALLGALGGGTTGGTAGNASGSGATAKPEAGEQGPSSSDALRDMLADTEKSGLAEQTGTLKDAKNASSNGDKSGTA